MQRVRAAGGFFQRYGRRGKRGNGGDRPRRGRWQKNQEGERAFQAGLRGICGGEQAGENRES